MHPTAFTIGGLPIAWYGILLATGFMVGIWTAGRRGMKIGLNAEDISNLMIWIFIGGIVGAKVLYVYNHWDQGSFKNLILSRSGMVFHGAFIGTSIAVWLFIRRTKMPLWATFDTLAPSFALGHAFGRIGCFTTSCCYGKTCDLPWSVSFPARSNPHTEHTRGSEHWHGMLEQSTNTVPQKITHNAQELATHYNNATNTSAEVYTEVIQKMNLLSRGDTNTVIGPIEQNTHDMVSYLNTHIHNSLPVHPTQIYECLLNLALYGALAWLFRKRKFDGQVFTAYLLGYAVLRFGMEFLRGDSRGHLWFEALTSGQSISILMLIGGGFLWWKLKERNQLQTAQEEA